MNGFAPHEFCPASDDEVEQVGFCQGWSGELARRCGRLRSDEVHDTRPYCCPGCAYDQADCAGPPCRRAVPWPVPLVPMVYELECRGCSFSTVLPRRAVEHDEQDACGRRRDVEAGGWEVREVRG